MENTISNSSVVEICIALEDFTYGNNVKVSIPTLNPLMKQDNIVMVKNKINKKNIMNKDKSYFNNINNSCFSTNYLSLLIPEELYRHSGNEYPSSYKGYKGEKFAVSFIGGDLDQPIVLRRI